MFAGIIPGRGRGAIAGVATCVALLGAGIQSGCATIDQTYYLMARDRNNDATNVYRINIHGCSSASKVKFSTGFYDRAAVERLFGENQIQREYLSTQVQQYDATGKRIQNLDSQLAHAAEADLTFQMEQMAHASASIAELFGEYQVKLEQNAELKSRFDLRMKRILELQNTAAGLLRTARDKQAAKALAEARSSSAEAATALREALGAISSIRLAVDGKSIVRFFDAAGNELDVSNKKLVIFVASDVSKFSEAIGQLAESNEAQEGILSVLQGPKVQKATALASEIARSDERERERLRRAEELLSRFTEANRPEDRTPTLLLLANIFADRVFASPDDLKRYLARRQSP